MDNSDTVVHSVANFPATHFGNEDESVCPSPPPPSWAGSCTQEECTLHQLSPYIGKLKSVIARDLILDYSKPGHLVADMFCGSGTVPLEAARLGRRVYASDSSTYAVTLTKGKLSAPTDIDVALMKLERLLDRVPSVPRPDLNQIPRWVRSFFHPMTLEETLRVFHVLKESQNFFLLSALLGILHHQRNGFLSYPSSHLVPYLRSRKFPRTQYPGLYAYRPVAPRLRAKVVRALKRAPRKPLSGLVSTVYQSRAENLELPSGIDCVVTSPPYMNALDYFRDNRLRLWFLEETLDVRQDRSLNTSDAFEAMMRGLVVQLARAVRPRGYCVFIVGDSSLRGGAHFPSEIVARAFLTYAPTFRLQRVIRDAIPDVRRSRRNGASVKYENILVFRQSA